MASTWQSVGPVVGLALFCGFASVSAQQSGPFSYTTNAGSATITGYSGSGGDVIIPSAIDGLSVTAIGDRAFFLVPGLTGVTIPDSLRSIGERAFEGCGLTSLTIPGTVTNISAGAFAYCSGLTNVSLPPNLTALGISAFFLCTNLINPPAIFSYTTIGAAVTVTDWDGSGRTVSFPPTINGLPVTAIGGAVGGALSRGFWLPPWVTNLTIPNGVTSIGDQAFDGAGLTQVTIPASVTNLGEQVFVACLGMTAINVDGHNAFYASVNGVVFDKGLTTLLQWPMGLGGSYTVPEGVVIIPDSAFQFSAVSSVTLPSSVTTIGASAFAACPLTNVVIEGSLTNLGDNAFADCPFLRCVFFMANAPPRMSLSQFASLGVQEGAIWYLPGTTGWPSWVPSNPSRLGGVWSGALDVPGVQAGHFTLQIGTAAHLPVLLEACTNLAIGAWVPLRTSNRDRHPDVFSFQDPASALYPARFYRIRPF